MIRPANEASMTPEQRHALSVLVECSRALPSDLPGSVELRLFDDASPAELPDPERHLRPLDGVVEVSGAALGLVTRIAAAADEQRSTAADRFGRVPATENYLAARGLERNAIVDRFGLALRQAIVEAARGRDVAFIAPWPEGKRWAVAVTHDLDVVSLWPAFTTLRAVELLRKGRVADVMAVARRAAAAAMADPVFAAASRVLEREMAQGIRSTWFIIAGTPTLATIKAGDVTYSPESRPATRIIRAARDAGHEIALHGSFETWTDTSRFRAQRERLERIVGKPVHGVRQHFIRMRPGASHRAMREAGFAYDSTFGFADRNGFRLGTAQPLPLWDDSLQRPLSIQAVPFVWMDRALSKYRGVEDPRAWVEDAMATARACREVEGLWTGIWHPNLATALGFPGAEEAFDDLVQRLVADRPWSATLAEITEWRASRRALRAATITDDGAIGVAGHAGTREIPLEDHMGRPLPSVRV